MGAGDGFWAAAGGTDESSALVLELRSGLETEVGVGVDMTRDFVFPVGLARLNFLFNSSRIFSASVRSLSLW